MYTGRERWKITGSGNRIGTSRDLKYGINNSAVKQRTIEAIDYFVWPRTIY